MQQYLAVALGTAAALALAVSVSAQRPRWTAYRITVILATRVVGGLSYAIR